MATLDLAVYPMFAALLTDGSVFLELAIGDEDHLAKATMPASEVSRPLAAPETTPLDLDVLPHVSPALAREIEEFVGEIRRRLIERAVQA